MLKGSEIIINVPLQNIKEGDLEDVFVFGKMFSRDPDIFFAELKNGTKIIFTVGWRTDSRILENGYCLIYRNALDVIFTKVQKYQPFLVYEERKRKIVYTRDLSNISSLSTVISIKKPILEIYKRVIRAIEIKLNIL